MLRKLIKADIHYITKIKDCMITINVLIILIIESVWRVNSV